MNDLTETEFFILLSERNQIEDIQIKNAYGKFTEQIKKLNQPDEKYATIYRMLNITRVEIVSLQSHFQYEQGGKCAYKSVSAKSNRFFRFRTSSLRESIRFSRTIHPRANF